ncbi:MAG: helicase associated domain-containing protein, partial [Burkholderiales bacterium]
WINTQRANFKIGKMNADHIKLLQSIGFNWAPMDESWNIHYVELADFFKKHGHCDIRKKDNAELAYWVTELRKNGKRRGLSEARLAQLATLKFEWNPHEADWEKQYKALLNYKALRGDCIVPADWAKNKSLGRWSPPSETTKTPVGYSASVLRG